MRVEISCDDGHLLDLRVARLLDKYHLRGIFFIPTGITNLSVADIRELSKNHEIGAHTYDHPSDMKLLIPEQLKYQLEEPKIFLEDIVGKEVTKFCYPRGRFNAQVKQAVAAAGYDYARTTRIGQVKDALDRLEVDTSVHLYPRKEYEGEPVLEYALRKLEEAHQFEDGYYHLWMHAWEIEDLGYWDTLETILSALEGKQ